MLSPRNSLAYQYPVSLDIVHFSIEFGRMPLILVDLLAVLQLYYCSLLLKKLHFIHKVQNFWCSDIFGVGADRFFSIWEVFFLTLFSHPAIINKLVRGVPN